MRSFKHVNARTVEETCSLLADYEGKAVVHAGGTELLSMLKGECLSNYPEAVINIKTLSGLDHIREERGVLKIGALTKLSDTIRAVTEAMEQYQFDFALKTIREFAWDVLADNYIELVKSLLEGPCITYPGSSFTYFFLYISRLLYIGVPRLL
jgi:hypothetical protein